MTTPEEVLAFEHSLRRQLMSGAQPDEAIRAAMDESGVELEAERIKALIRVLRLAEVMTRDPEFLRKRDALDARWRELAKAGMSISRAVKQAQEDTGVHLGEQGEHILIQTLEEETEKARGMRIEVVSDSEFAAMQHERCMPFNHSGVDGWQCCKCTSFNTNGDKSCRSCSHDRCVLQ